MDFLDGIKAKVKQPKASGYKKTEYDFNDDAKEVLLDFDEKDLDKIAKAKPSGGAPINKKNQPTGDSGSDQAGFDLGSDGEDFQYGSESDENMEED